jgi:hypothetical protein
MMSKLNLCFFLFVVFPCFALDCDNGSLCSVDQPAIRLFVGILSAPSYVERRDAVRSSWLRHVNAESCGSNAFVSVKFFIGGPRSAALEREQAEFDDIVFDSAVEEAYLKLLDKTVAMFRHAVKSPLAFTHIVKTDDDCFVSVARLCDDLRRRTSAPNVDYYYGFMHNNSFVIRTPGVKFSEPKQTDCQHHLPYASGALYMLTRRLAQFVVENRPRLRSFNNEDVAIGFWLAPLELVRVHQARIRPERAASDEWSKLCPAEAGSDTIAQHRLTPAEMKRCVHL